MMFLQKEQLAQVTVPHSYQIRGVYNPLVVLVFVDLSTGGKFLKCC
jgi:hypothetical protein